MKKQDDKVALKFLLTDGRLPALDGFGVLRFYSPIALRIESGELRLLPLGVACHRYVQFVDVFTPLEIVGKTTYRPGEMIVLTLKNPHPDDVFVEGGEIIARASVVDSSGFVPERA